MVGLLGSERRWRPKSADETQGDACVFDRIATHSRRIALDEARRGQQTK